MKRLIVLLVCSIWVITGWAIDNRLEKSVSANLTYTDNIGLRSTNEKSGFIVSVTPNMSLHREAARSNIDLVAALEINSQNEGGENFNPRLQFDSNWELFEDHFFLDLNATAAQNSSDPFTSTSINSVNSSGDVATTYDLEISPYFINRFRRYADLEVRYTRDKQINKGSVTNGSTSDIINISLNSGEAFSRVFWGLNYTKDEISSEQTTDSNFESYNATIGFALNRSWRINGSVGVENNDFTSTRSSNDGDTWGVDVVWSPSPRTSLTVGYEDRFFGGSPTLDFEHRFRRSAINLSYSKQVTNSTRLLRNQQVFQIVDQFGNPIINPASGNPFLVSSNLATLNDVTFIDERLDGSYSYQGRRSNITWNISHSRQSDETGVSGGSSSTLFDTGLTYTRELSRKNSLNTSIQFNQTEQGTLSGTNDSDRHQFNIGLSHQLDQNSSIDINYSYSKQDSDNALVATTTRNEYTENRLTLGFSHQFK
ncbi:MAG: TIGR03016 family PEP-CTERM system-associated outer membrane protein [Piscirickettsiaceae bacterium]|nr:MAG: TIGR03016 family PEP-CTERM system-associated outer membrane protein [Piscirickettsiaceae bacterium]